MTFDEAQRRCSAQPDVPLIDLPASTDPYRANWMDEYAPLPTGTQPAWHTAVDPGGNPSATTCKIDTEVLEVRCCSDTQVGSLTPVQGMDTAAAAANVALGRACTQSSTNGGAACDRAFDGDTNANFADGSVSHTGRAAAGGFDFIQVDLGSTILLQGVTVTKRGDCCGGRQNTAHISVSATTDYNAADATDCGTLGSGGATTVSCSVSGRYVTLWQPRMFIHIAEMEVMAAHTETCSTAFPAGMPFSTAFLDNAVTQATPPDAPAFAFIEGPCGAGYGTILDLPTCQAAVDFLEFGNNWYGSRDSPTDPGGHWIEGCSHRNDNILFHDNGASSTTGWGSAWAANLRTMCKLVNSTSAAFVNGCVSARTHNFAEQVCAAEGARLCTPAEVAAECVAQAPCTYRQGLMWTSELCSPPVDTMDICENWNWIPPAAQLETNCGQEDLIWRNTPCEMQIQVAFDGTVNQIINAESGAANNFNVNINRISEMLRLDHVKSLGKWGVKWTDGLFPDPEANCNGSPDCQPHSFTGQSDTCLCTVSVTETAVYTDMAALPSREDVLDRLKIGAASPDTFDAGTYLQIQTGDVGIWTLVANSTLNADTIFAVVVKGVTKYYLNKESMAGFSGFTFRNPPQFLKIEGSTLDTDTFYETEAMIDSFFYHDNVAPYISHALIQRFVTSNPSPRYVQAVATAFTTGTYDGRTYSGKYGDMAALVGAMLLDREARSAAISADGTHGMLREPFASTMHVFRAMEYSSDYEIHLADLKGKIGQEPFGSPSVFNYYKPDYSPAGKISQAGLYSPEAELLTSPLTVGMFNALHSLVDYGLHSCESGFSEHTFQDYNGGAGYCGTPDQNSKGQLTLPPPVNHNAVEVVEQLDLLLTGGRLSAENKASIVETVDASHYRSMYMVAHGQGAINPVTGDVGMSSYCAAAGDVHDVSCCSDVRGDNGEHGDLVYGMGHRFAAVAAISNPLWVGAWITEGCGSCDNNGCKNVCCVLDNDYPSAAAVCAADGARLCTVQELEAGCAGYNGCGHNADFLWSSTPCTVDATEDAQKLAVKLILGTSEFRTTADNRLKPSPRVPFPPVQSQGRPYKAVVMFFLSGGADSYNMIVPHSNCAGGVDQFAEYQTARGAGADGVALMPNQLLPFSVPAGTQVCDTFGLHYKLPTIKQMYDDGDVAFIANMGSLVEPLTRAEFFARSKRIPEQLFSHANQQKQSASVHPQNPGAKGIIGRILDALQTQTNPYKSQAFSIAGNKLAVQGRSAPTYIHSRRGIAEFVQFGRIALHYQNISALESNSIYADTWAESLATTLISSRNIAQIYASGSTTESFNIACPSLVNCSPKDQLKAVAKMMSVRAQTGNEREAYYVDMGTWDYHSDNRGKTGKSYTVVDLSLAAFKREMVHQGLWDSVTVVMSSDFGRTITGNGLGTDHAWGGNYFMLGGAVAGGQMHGEYPLDLSLAAAQRNNRPLDSLEIGRGRLIPTSPWDTMWHAVAQWMDLDASKMTEVLPNSVNFQVGSAAGSRHSLLTRAQAFTN